ncbi:WD repeat-containing protein 27-like isoform X2 [Ruditapes philippinarum]|nr:WD repeat-containing protein 27-like isoform X2 [Ruditapes philippinarum]
MDIQYVHSQRVAFTPAHVQLACDGLYLALPLTRSTVGIWSLQDISCKPLELVGHSKILRALALGNLSVPKQLVSAAEDYVIIWNLQQARRQFEKGEKIKGRVIGTTLGCVQYCSLSPNDSLVAVCVDIDIVILQAARENKIAVLEGHNGTVTAAEFCPHYTSTLVSISDDRTFKVWNLEDLTLVYQSPILTPSPFLSVAMNIHEPRVAIGAADGVIRVIDLTDGNGFRCLHQFDVGKVIAKEKDAKFMEQNETKKGPVTISSRPTWKQGDRNNSVSDVPDNIDDSVEAGSSVLCLYYTYVHEETLARQATTVSRDLPFLSNKTDVVGDLLKTSPMLMVGTTAGMLEFNARTLDMAGYVDFQDPVSCKDNLNADTKTLNAAGTIIFGQSADNKIWCIVGSPFQNVVHILKWGKSESKSRNQTPVSRSSGNQTPGSQSSSDLTDIEDRFSAMDPSSRAESIQKQIEITVLSKSALLDDSPLRADMTPKTKDTKDKVPRDFVTPPKKGAILDKQPVTFKTKIKSSGYTAAPRMTMFTPSTNISAKPKILAKSSTRQTQSAREYPVRGNPPVNLSTKFDVAERPTAVNTITVSDGGQNLACALANKSALVFSVPLSNKGSTAYTGHNHIVTCVDWSHTGSRLLTCSDDKTACVWIKGQSDPVMTFDRMVKNTANTESKINKKDNKAYSKEVHFGQFYFMDKFILLCVGNQLLMYKYYIDTNKNDIQRYLAQGKYKLVQEWGVESQQVTSMSAINSFLSYIVLCACSNKSIEVFDLNTGQMVRKMTDVHSRPVHALCQNEGSQFVSHPSSAYDLFASAAAGDCIKLWDLRTNRCVRRYEGHLNRVHPCGLSFSPCGRFIATGSEDKCSYIFDMRSGTFLHKLQGHTDVVSDVAFHPSTPQLYTCSLDGKLNQYTNR